MTALPSYLAFHTDGATLMVLHRAFGDVSPAATREGAVTRIDTGALIIRHDASSPLFREDGVDFWWMDWQQGCDYRKIAGDTYRETGLDAITPLWMLNHTHYLAAQRHPIGFSGDTCITWKSLDFQPYFTAAASNVGMAGGAAISAATWAASAAMS